MQKTALTLMLATLGTGAASAQNQPPSSNEDQTRVIQELRGMVNSLQEQVDELKATSNDNWLTQKRAEEIRGLVQDVLADADTRASLLETGATGGWDKGFFIASTDGNFRLNVGGQIQVRFVYDHRNDPPASAPDENRSGFEVRRAKLILKGNVLDPSWQYDVQFAADRNTGDVQLEDAGWIRKDFGGGWKATLGQMKAPYMYEEILSSRYLFAVERSLLDSFFTAGTVQGLAGSYETEHLRFTAMYYDGANSGSTSNLNKGWQAEDTEWGALGGRVDWLVTGDWKYTTDYDAWRGQDTTIMVGAATNYQKSEFGTGSNAPPPDFNNNEVGNFGFTLDGMVKFNGFGFSGAFVYRSLDPQTGANADQVGFYLQGGFFICDTVELYARYEWADADLASVPDNLSVFTVGASKFFDRHNLKWQTDLGYGINPVDSAFANTGAGWQADSPDEDGQIVLRSQFQLLF